MHPNFPISRPLRMAVLHGRRVLGHLQRPRAASRAAINLRAHARQHKATLRQGGQGGQGAPSPCRTPSSCPTDTGPRSSSAGRSAECNPRSDERREREREMPLGVIAHQQRADQHLMEGWIEPQKLKSKHSLRSLRCNAPGNTSVPRTRPLNTLGNGCLNSELWPTSVFQ